jgi:site-specific DNA-methyltransferase (adenine-specific)
LSTSNPVQLEPRLQRHLKDESGRKSDAQILAFEDTWHWGPGVDGHYTSVTNAGLNHGKAPSSVSTIGCPPIWDRREPDVRYLVEMAVRLVELHRVLKPAGSLYLHCDPAASQYLKIVLNAAFAPENYKNDVRVHC